jgi:hypothetical protein
VGFVYYNMVNNLIKNTNDEEKLMNLKNMVEGFSFDASIRINSKLNETSKTRKSY